ncbi:unnamed protein product [Microthlaspi erraticum]|uniref:Uncharacterized protein n=1 Tax=Microthlaspi erraticum TaxID=1685480 RepID=A0A6D2KSZ8_9BRAS|nr:unnamed protein product [Microthlaspi erraticum]
MVDYVSSDHIYGVVGKSSSGVDGENLFHVAELMTMGLTGLTAAVAQQYRAREFTSYSELMQILLVAEKNNQLVMLNHQLRPTGSAPFPEANVASSSHTKKPEHERRHGKGRVAVEVVDVEEKVMMVER